jgi:hypothetical protein
MPNQSLQQMAAAMLVFRDMAAVMAKEGAHDPHRAAVDEFWANYEPGY